MKLWIALSFFSFSSLAWTYVHTDEITVVFALLLAAGFLLGIVAPGLWVPSGLVLGAACPMMEVLIVTLHLHAPFEGGHPLEACAGFVPALAGTALGRLGSRHLGTRLQ